MILLFHALIYAINELSTPRCIIEIREIAFEVSQAFNDCPTTNGAA